MATMRQVSWRSAAALPPLALIGYSLWRVGEQVTGGLDPNFTANAWGGPTYLGAMALSRSGGGQRLAADNKITDTTITRQLNAR